VIRLLKLSLLLTLPDICRVVYWMVSSVAGGKQEPLKFIVPYLTERLRDRQDHSKTPDINSDQSVGCMLHCYGQRVHTLPWLQVTVADLLMDAAPPGELADIRLLAMRVMNLNFAAIHTRCAYFHNDIPSPP